MLEENREKYEQFFKAFGMQLKFGVYNNFGMDKDKLKDLILFHSSTENKLTTFKEYVSRMKEKQEKSSIAGLVAMTAGIVLFAV